MSSVDSKNAQRLKGVKYVGTLTDGQIWKFDNASGTMIPGSDGNSTNLGIDSKTATQLDVTSDTGTNATIPEATATEAGLLSVAKRAEIIANNAKVTNVSTDLSHLADATQISLNSSDGADTTLVGASGTLAGLLTVAKRAEIIANTLKVTFPEAPNDGTQYSRKNLGWEAVASPSGIVGISNASGVYTYYATLTLAMTAAVSGDTVTLFANIEETGAVEIILKDGVNINLNGYTYTLNVATVESSIVYRGGTPIECVIFNGTVKRIGGGVSTLQYLCFYLSGQTNITLKDVKVVNATSTALASLNASSVINGGTYSSPYYTFGIYGGKAININSYSASGIAYYASNSSSYNCFVHSDGNYGIEVAATAANFYGCTGTSSVNIGFFVATSSTGEIVNCVGKSDTSTAFQIGAGTGKVMQCTGTSKISYGILSGRDINNCSGFSDVGDGGLVSANATNCSFESIGTGRGIYLAGGALYNCFVKSKTSDAVFMDVSGGDIFNSSLEVLVAAKFCLTTAGTFHPVFYGQNTFKGSTVAVAATVVNLQINNGDNKGNILIG